MFTSKREAVLVVSVWIGGGLVFVLLLCNVLFGVIQAPPPTSRADVGPPEAYLRADAFLVLWTPGTTLPVDQIQVFADGTASRAFLPAPDPRAFVTVLLPADLLQDLDALRNQWCATAPTVAPQADNVGVSTCAIQCRPFHTPTYRIPADHLPAPLEDLMEMMPPAPTGVPMTPCSSVCHGSWRTTIDEPAIRHAPNEITDRGFYAHTGRLSYVPGTNGSYALRGGPWNGGWNVSC